MKRVFLMIVLLFVLVNNVVADELIFNDYDQYVNKLDFQLEIFELKFNYLNVYTRNPYIQAIDSVGYLKKIYSYVYLNDSIAQIPKNKKKEVLRDICEEVFRLYKDNFVMFDEQELKALKDGTIKSASGHKMNPSNLKIHLHLAHNLKFVGTWYGGYLELEGE